jgi:hypothetical protein
MVLVPFGIKPTASTICDDSTFSDFAVLFLLLSPPPVVACSPGCEGGILRRAPVGFQSFFGMAKEVYVYYSGS